MFNTKTNPYHPAHSRPRPGIQFKQTCVRFAHPLYAGYPIELGMSGVWGGCREWHWTTRTNPISWRENLMGRATSKTSGIAISIHFIVSSPICFGIPYSARFGDFAEWSFQCSYDYQRCKGGCQYAYVFNMDNFFAYYGPSDSKHCGNFILCTVAYARNICAHR